MSEGLPGRYAIGADALVQRLAPLAVLGDPEDVLVRGVVHHDDDVVPGALFCCLPGVRTDGHSFAASARRRGAAAFVCEHSLPGVGGLQLIVGPGNARHAMAEAACALYGDPARDLVTVGVTGTNGKTTVTHLVGQILELHGWRCGVLGTLDGARTTPEAPVLQRNLAELRDGGTRAVAMEVTSHALVQSRVDGIVFDVAAFTNLSQDHLDYHGTMESYFAAKALLFTAQRCRGAVVNSDDPYGRRLLERASVPTTGFSVAAARPRQVGVGHSVLELFGRTVQLPLGGRFNVENALAAAFVARQLGVEEQTILDALSGAEPVAGRLEVLTAEPFVVVVDYAHTPAGLAQLLATAREGAPAGRVIVVFGCGGERDRGKRPAMGKVAAELADVAVVTSDNPRSENPRSIIDQVLAGVPACSPRMAEIAVEPDRRAAIAEALRRARPGDVVLIAGKGHEQAQQLGDRSVPFDDREVARRELARLARVPRRAGEPARSA